MNCFFCNPSTERQPDAPGAWSHPRMLCGSHNVTLELADGQPLKTVLDRVKPANHQLEGSLLGWIFNPVFINVNGEHKLRAWTDFAGGGMAVLEDRFSAQNYFEFRAFETTSAVDLLFTLCSAMATGTPITSTKELISAVLSAGRSTPHAARGPAEGAFTGWMNLTEVWNFQLQLDRLRISRERHWPESFSELGEWINECHMQSEEPQQATEALLFRELGQLALRRFPVINR